MAMTIGNAEHAWLRKIAPNTNYAGAVGYTLGSTNIIFWDTNSAYACGARRIFLIEWKLLLLLLASWPSPCCCPLVRTPLTRALPRVGP